MLKLILSYFLDETFINRTILVAGLCGPAVGLLVGFLVGKVRHRVRPDAADGLLIGLFGTLTMIMWHVYNAIVERMGLDTVKNLLVNLVLFLAVGLILGYLVRRVRPRLHGDIESAGRSDG